MIRAFYYRLNNAARHPVSLVIVSDAKHYPSKASCSFPIDQILTEIERSTDSTKCHHKGGRSAHIVRTYKEICAAQRGGRKVTKNVSRSEVRFKASSVAQILQMNFLIRGLRTLKRRLHRSMNTRSNQPLQFPQRVRIDLRLSVGWV